MQKLKNTISSIYQKMFQNQIVASFLAVLPFALYDNLLKEVYVISFFALMFSLIAQRKYTKKELFCFSLLFCFWFILREFIWVLYSMKETYFFDLEIIFYGLSLLFTLFIKSIVRIILGLGILSFMNFVILKLINVEKLKKVTLPILNFINNPIKVILSVIICFIIFNLFSLFTFVNVDITQNNEFAKANPNVNILYTDRLILKSKKNKQNEKGNNIIDSVMFKLNNGNTIRRDIIEFTDKNIKKRKAHIKVVSQDKKENILTMELPEFLVDSNIDMIELTNGNIMFLSGNPNYILDIANKTISATSKLKKDKSFSSAINLKDGRVFLFAADNISEIYNVQTDMYIEVPIGFLPEMQNVNLFLLSDNRVLISCLKFYDKKEDGIGTYSSSQYATGYPAPYLTIFNPADNSFTEIEINKSKKYKRDKYGITVLPDNKIVISGGYYVNTMIWKMSTYANDILVYDIKRNKLKKSKKKLIYNRYNPTIMPLSEKQILVCGGDEFINPKSLGIGVCELVSFK